MKKVGLCALILLFTILLFGCGKGGGQPAPTSPAPAKNEDASAMDKETTVAPVVYKNTQYGFSFTLRDDWKGFTVVEGKWEGLDVGGAQGQKVVETGPQIALRHPKWTKEPPRQDIPIMIFTLRQWNDMQKDKFHIGAAPIGPSELGRNAKYVFALPARYNFAFPEGFKEVEEIINSKPLQAIE